MMNGRGGIAVGLVVGSAVWALSCTTRSALYCDRDTPCTDSAIPYCDLDGELQSAANRCIENPFGACEVDSDCPANAPICDPFVGCLPCTDVSGDDASSVDSSGDAACAARSAATPLCYDDGRCIGCTSTDECGDDAPICDPTSLTCTGCPAGAAGDVACTIRGGGTDVCDPYGHCVECLRDAQCPDPDQAFCGDDGLCRGCAAHTECDSGICDRSTGLCVPEDQIQYDSLDTPPDGVSYIKLGNGIWELDGPFFVPGANIVGSGATVIKTPFIRNAGGFVDDAIIMDAYCSGASFHNDIFVRSTAGSTIYSSTFSESTVKGNQLDVHDCTFEISGGVEGTGLVADSQLSGGTVAIVGTGNGTLTVDRCAITGSQAAAAIKLDGVDYEIRNTLIAGNAGHGIEVVDDAPSTAIIEMSTIADNGGIGVICGGTSTAASSTIVRGNAGGQVTGACAWRYSNIEGGSAGPHNVDADGCFAAAELGDYHLLPGSACVDRGDPELAPTTDREGDPRPLGAGIDIGSDELVP